MHVRMAYNPPAGALGHAVAALFGGDPKQVMDEDLVRFKSLIDEGKTTAHLYVLRGAHDVGRECEGCRALQRGLGAVCSYCRRETRTVDLEEAIIDRVIATGGGVTLVERHAWLSRQGGVAATLRYAA